MLLVPLFVAATVIDVQWPMILACPRVSAPNATKGTGVVIGVKDGFAYLLTASHVAPYDGVEVAFTSRAEYPRVAWVERAAVVARWPDPDLALARFPVGKHAVSVLPLAPAWERPKSFPVPAATVGIGGRDASTVLTDTIRAKEFVTREGKQPAFFWQTVTPPESGRSGGPLLDTRGRVIGIAIAARGGSGYYAHHDEILAALKRDGYGFLVPGR